MATASPSLNRSPAGVVINDTSSGNQIIRNGCFAAAVSLQPTTPGHTIITADGIDNFAALSVEDFISLMTFTKATARALEDAIGVQRIGLAADDKTINLIPLHGLEKDWEAVVHTEEVFHATYPGYLNSKNGPKMSASDLEAMRTMIAAVSGLPDAYDKTFHGDQDDQNLFARIVRGELEQWRIWEDENHVAFLTPFANTPGFTVLVPRRHSHSDIFRLDDTSYNSLLHASFSVMGILKRALGVPAVGLFFEGFEIDYTHAKLIPIHASESQSSIGSTSVQPAPFYEKYPGYITTQPGPVGKLESLGELVGKIQQAFVNYCMCYAFWGLLCLIC